MSVVVVAGTGTEIGKTWVTAALATALRAPRHRGRRPQARAVVRARARRRRPTPTCSPPRPARTRTPCVRRTAGSRAPMAPPMAADALGARRVHDRRPRGRAHADAPADVIVLVESAGGVRSPLAADGDTVDLVDALQPALVVLVADAGLGTINLVRLSVDALAADRVVVYLNRFDGDDDLHRAQPRLARDARGPRGRHRPRGPRQHRHRAPDALSATG